MDNRNAVVLIGRLVADPELRYLPSGDPVVNFAIAVNRSVPKDGGGFEDALDGFFDCDVFGGLALTVTQTMTKGSAVQLSGSLVQKKFKVGNGAGSRTVSKVQIRVRSIAAPLFPTKVEAAGPDAPVAQDAAVAQPASVPQPA